MGFSFFKFGKKNKESSKKFEKELPSLAKSLLSKSDLSSNSAKNASVSAIISPQASQQETSKAASENQKTTGGALALNDDTRVEIKPPPPISGKTGGDTTSGQSIKDFENYMQQEQDVGGYFSNLIEHLEKEEHTFDSARENEKFDEKQLIDEMKRFWSMQKSVAKKDDYKKKIQKEIIDKVEELQEHEKDWQMIELGLEKTRTDLIKKEELIKVKINELRDSFKKYKIVTDIKPEHYFRLNNGRELKNIFDLIDALEKMNDEMFSYHVNTFKNDFANWVKFVFKENELADNLLRTRDRGESIGILKAFYLL